MKRILFSVLIFFCLYLAGCCSIPRVANYKQLYSIAKEEKKTKGKFSKSKIVLTKDLRENEVFNQDIALLKEKVERYISGHADLSEPTKSNLRELRVTEGATKEEVKLLLGEPDKVMKSDKEDIASEIWIYRTNKSSTFTIVFIPVFFGHEKYYLYFKDNLLTLIERYYLEQTFYASDSNMGLQRSNK